MDALAQIGAVQRSERGLRVERVAGLKFGAFVQKQADEGFGHGFGNDDALGGVARLPRVAETGIARVFGRLPQVGIGQDDEGVAAAQFEHGFFQTASRFGSQYAACVGRAGKGQRVRIGDCLRDVGVFQPCGYQRDVCPGQFKQCVADAGDAWRGFDGTGVAGAQGGDGKTQHLPNGVVPRHDGQHHAQRFETHLAQAGLCGDGFVRQQFGGEAGVVADEFDRFVEFGAAFGQTAADFFADHARQPATLGIQALGDGGQQCGARGNGQFGEMPLPLPERA